MKLVMKALRFASEKHKNQRRKGPQEIPYINHPINIAYYLCVCCDIIDSDILIAAILHDTIEDTDASLEEIGLLFGENVLKIVEEVTDDKRLPRKVRKKLQIECGRSKSYEARLIKIADKIDNLNDLMKSPPPEWNLQKKIEYIDWTEKVVNEMRGTNRCLEDMYDKSLKEVREKLSTVLSTSLNNIFTEK